MKRLFFLISLSVVAITALAQSTVTITGKVISKEDGLPVIGAVVTLNAKDSTKLSQPGRVVATDANGQFTVRSREKESDITVSYMGMKDYFTKIEAGKTAVNLGTITLQPSAIGLDAAMVTADSKMAIIKGDTVQYNAAGFKTNPDASAEDLLKKMPGVTVDADGSINSQGQKITKVMVDGKEFFESDPTQALRALPSDAVESIGFFDGQSDNARFSGMDDGERIRTINITTKGGVSRSVFGKAWTGYGTDQTYKDEAGVLNNLGARYSVGGGISIWRGDHRFTITGGSNNVNNQGFNLSDIGGSSGGFGGGRGMMRSEGVSTGSFQTNSRGGITQSSNLGLNYNGTFTDKLKLTITYNFQNANGWSRTKNESSQLINNRNTTSRNQANSFDNRHSFQSRMEWSPTQKNRINFNTSISYGLNQGYSASYNESRQGYELNKGAFINSSDNSYTTKLESYNLNGSLWWQRALGKAGRTLSVGGTGSANRGMGDNEQYSQIKRASVMSGIDFSTIDRVVNLNTRGHNVAGSFTYNEPLTQYAKISANYNLNYNRTFADQNGLNWNDIAQRYDIIDTATTNYINRNYTTHTTGLAYNYAKGRDVTINFGLDYLYAIQNSDQQRPGWIVPHQQYNFSAIQPSARLRLVPKLGQSIQLDLRRNANFPSVTQLQDVLDMTNPLSVSKGNPDLRQSYQNFVNVRYNIANLDNNTNFNIMAMVSLQENSVVADRRILEKNTEINGVVIAKNSTYSTYTNLNGAWNWGTYATYTLPLKLIKSNLSAGVNYRYAKSPSLQNGLLNTNNSNISGGNFVLTSNVSENIDFTIRYYPSLNLSTNINDKNTLFTRKWSHNLQGTANIYLTKFLFVNADGSWNNVISTAANSDQHYFIINAAVGFKFLKNRAGEFKVQAYDIMNQSRSFVQDMASNGDMSYSWNYSMLTRYVMFSLMYKFDTRKGNQRRSTEDEMTPERERMIMRMGSGGGGRGGMMGH